MKTVTENITFEPGKVELTLQIIAPHFKVLGYAVIGLSYKVLIRDKE